MLDGKEVKTSEIDNDELHLNEHISFMLGQDYEKKLEQNEKLEEIFLKHIREHKKKLGILRS